MSLIGEQILLRIYLQSADRAPRTPTYERIVKAARAKGLAGATVLRGIMGFGSRGLIKHSSWSLADHVPIIVEIVDSAERISAFLTDDLDPLLIGGMATLERASVTMHRPSTSSPSTQGGGDQISNPGFPLLLPPLSTLPPLQPGPRMTQSENGILLRVFIGESDRLQDRPLYEAIVQRARELGLAGATVLRGTEGFGANSIVHKANLLEMSSDLPIVIEIVDAQDKINLLLPHLESMVREGMITMEYVAIVLYRHDPARHP